MPRIVAAVLVVLVVAGAVSGCAGEPDRAPEAVPPPVLGVLVGSAGECPDDATPIHEQARGLVTRGLRDAGYRTLFVACDRAVPIVDDPATVQALADDGLRVERIAVDDPRVDQAVPAGVRPAALRSVITRRVMLAQSLVLSGDVDRIPAENLPLLTNPDVLVSLLDSRRRPGAPVGDDPQIYARAVREKGLLVSLDGSGDTPERRTVAIADLGLAGDDSVPATELWSGRRLLSHGGYLSVDVPPGDTALLRIG